MSIIYTTDLDILTEQVPFDFMIEQFKSTRFFRVSLKQAKLITLPQTDVFNCCYNQDENLVYLPQVCLNCNQSKISGIIHGYFINN